MGETTTTTLNKQENNLDVLKGIDIKNFQKELRDLIKEIELNQGDTYFKKFLSELNSDEDDKSSNKEKREELENLIYSNLREMVKENNHSLTDEEQAEVLKSLKKDLDQGSSRNTPENTISGTERKKQIGKQLVDILDEFPKKISQEARNKFYDIFKDALSEKGGISRLLNNQSTTMEEKEAQISKIIKNFERNLKLILRPNEATNALGTLVLQGSQIRGELEKKIKVSLAIN